MKRKLDICRSCQNVHKEIINLEIEGSENVKTTIAYSCEKDNRYIKGPSGIVAFTNIATICTKENLPMWEKADVPDNCSRLMEYKILEQNLQ